MIVFLSAQFSDPSDEEFMIQLYEDFRGLMFSVAGHYTNNWADREDIIQESLVNLIKKIDLLRTKNRCILASYIVSTIKNTSINHLRKQKNMTRLFVQEQPELCVRAFSVDELARLVERKDELHRLWVRLSERERFLLAGRYLYGLADDEIAQQLGCKPDSVRMMVSRARKTALSLLNADEMGDNHDET